MTHVKQDTARSSVVKGRRNLAFLVHNRAVEAVRIDVTLVANERGTVNLRI